MSDRTTVGLTRERRDQLNAFKHDERLSSFDAAIAELLNRAEIEASGE